MQIGIMQPYFFPYIGYFELIFQTDKWIVFDVVQYNVKSWMNRNRILHPKDGWQYFGVPVKKTPRGTLIKDINIINKEDALRRILGQITHYKNKARYYSSVVKLIKDCFLSTTTSKLVDLNIATLSTVCIYLEITFQWKKCSELKLDLIDIEHPGQWALKICKQLGATKYLNPSGGKEIFRPAEFSENNIDLRFLKPSNYQYDCYPYNFERNLSIIDVMMWNSPNEILSYIREMAGSTVE